MAATIVLFSRSPCVASTSGRRELSTPASLSCSTLRSRAPAIAARLFSLPLSSSNQQRRRHRSDVVAARGDGDNENAPSSSSPPSSSSSTAPLRRSGSDPMAEAAYEGWAFSSVPQKGGKDKNSSSASASSSKSKKKTSTAAAAAATDAASEWGTQSLSDGQLVDALYEDDGSPELVAQNVLAVSLALLLAASLGGVLVRIGAVAAALVVAAVRYSVVAVLLLLVAVVLTPKR